MATVQNLTIRQQSGASGTYYASWKFKATTISSTSSNSTSASNGIKTGDLVSIKSGATYYNGVAIPKWVMAKRWYVVQVKGDRAVLGKSEDGANNIQSAVKNFADRGYAQVKGILLNHRNVENETEKVEAFAKEHDLKIIGDIPRSNDINRYEEMGMTTIEGDINLEVSQKFLELAKKLLEDES